MAILISQKNAGSASDLTDPTLTAYTFNAAAAITGSTNLFFGLADTAEQLTYSGGNLRVADVSTGDKFIIADFDFTDTATDVNIKTVGNSIVLSHGTKTYTFASIAAGDSFEIVLGTPVVSSTPIPPVPPVLTITRTGDVYDLASSETAAIATITGTNTAIDFKPRLVSQEIDASGNLILTFSEAISAVGTGNITITGASGIVTTVDVTDAAQVAIGTPANVITIDPTVSLLRGDTYTVEIADGAFTDGTNPTIEYSSNNSTALDPIPYVVNGTLDAPVVVGTSGTDILNGNQGAVGYEVALDLNNGGASTDDVVIRVTDNHAANIAISNFDAETSTVAGDRLVFDVTDVTSTVNSLVEANAFYSFGVSADGLNTILTHNVDGMVQHITLVGINDASSPVVGGTIDSVTELSTFLGADAIVFI